MGRLGRPCTARRCRRRCRTFGVLLAAALAASAVSAVSEAAVAREQLQAVAAAVASTAASPSPLPPLPPSPPSPAGATAADNNPAAGSVGGSSRQSNEQDYNEQAAAYERERKAYCQQFPYNHICSEPALEPLTVPQQEVKEEEQQQQQQRPPTFFTAPPQPQEQEQTWQPEQQRVPTFFTAPPEPPEQDVPQPRPRDLSVDDLQSSSEVATPTPQATSSETEITPTPQATSSETETPLPEATPLADYRARPVPQAVPLPSPIDISDSDIDGGGDDDTVDGDGVDGSDTSVDGTPQEQPQATPTQDPVLGSETDVVASSEVCLLKNEWDDYLRDNEKALKKYNMPDKERKSFTEAIKGVPTKIGKYHCFRDQAEFDYMGELVANAFSTAKDAQMTERVLLSDGDGDMPGDLRTSERQSCLSRAYACMESWRYGCTSRRLCCCPSFCVGYFDTVFSSLRIAQSTVKRSTNSCCVSCFC
ncbi:hypothetical protein BU14_0111s0052 [Porphyra umbilicalis]|uniref:Cathepsin propeptide inhibitor domain-containing protein n=1 Tax=Porphyra umbilicalis TaxID=2786 RepID=A0A1X6PBY7_PORUM|nr:hypothetical protein BU14_0111s0052 [Porphyra umbilicalis]|eukprot:OSX78382.1 hypothetical protein BU14_0111s0052 [Porphyra umbilicalis]